jgi:methionyl-tRNA synthetase
MQVDNAALKYQLIEHVEGHWRRSKLDRIIVTTALIYANGEIHLGHITSTYLPADIFVRFCRLRGHDVVHVGATDDFGTPILVEAERSRKSPEDFVAYWNQVDQKDFTDLGISYDIFYKTSSEENKELTQHFFRKLYENGHIFKRIISQPYCETDRKFLPDRYVKGTCPYCGAVEQYSDSCENCGRTFQPGQILTPHCAICGSTPVSKESEHYFFKLSEFADALKDWLDKNTNLQQQVKNYVLSWIKEGLKDWDISRDIPWGVPIPLNEAEGKVLYGWFDNHLGYISTAQKYFAEKGINGKERWNSSKIYHFIGKDIVYHHYLFLPSMRLGEGEYKLPDYIPTRGYFLLEGEKFSKSRGWYISLRDFLDKFPADYLRYYLASITPYSQSDVNFDWADFQKRINNELIANIGNFINRSLTFIWSRYEGKVPTEGAFDELDEKLIEEIKTTPQDVGAKIEKNELSQGLGRIIEFSAFCNQYFQRKQPWTDPENAKTCLYLSVNAVRTLAILLEPYTPFSAEELWQQLKLEGSVHEQDWDSSSILGVRNGHSISKPGVLFRKVEDKDIQKEENKLRSLASNRR